MRVVGRYRNQDDIRKLTQLMALALGIYAFESSCRAPDHPRPVAPVLSPQIRTALRDRCKEIMWKVDAEDLASLVLT